MSFSVHSNGTAKPYLNLQGGTYGGVEVDNGRLRFNDDGVNSDRSGTSRNIAFELVPGSYDSDNSNVLALDDRVFLNAYGFMLSDNTGTGTYNTGSANIVLERASGEHTLRANNVIARSSSSYFLDLFTTGLSLQTAGDIRLRDDQYLGFGNSDDAKMYYDDGNTELELELESTVSDFRIHDNGTTRFTFARSSGDFTATGNVTAYSDERLKSDIETLDPSKTLQMRGVEFTKDGKKGSGVIAQELEKIAPELVRNEGEYKSGAYGNLSGYLIETIKDQQKQIDELKALIEKLTEKV